jgi:hypothetical protein
MTSIWSGWTGNFNRGRSKRFSSAPKHPDQLWAQPASYAMCIWSYFVGVKWPAHQVEHSPPTKVEVKNKWSNTSPTLTFLPQGQLYLLWIGHNIFCSLFQIKVFSMFSFQTIVFPIDSQLPRPILNINQSDMRHPYTS